MILKPVRERASVIAVQERINIMTATGEPKKARNEPIISHTAIH